MDNSRFYNNGALEITLDDYIRVFTAVKRELDLNQDDETADNEEDREGDHRYDNDIALAITDNAYKLAKEELWPNLKLSTTFTMDDVIDMPGFFNIDLTAISRILNVSLLDGSGKVITKCVPRQDFSCCGYDDSCLSYSVDGNHLIFNNSDKLDPNIRYSMQLLTDGGNLDYWFGHGWRLLTQAVKCDMFLNYFKSLDAYNACLNNYMLLYKDLVHQTAALSTVRIKPNRIYW